MKKVFFTGILIAGIFSSCAQVRCNINKASAFFTVSIPGAQMVDETGNPVPPVPQVTRFIYLEFKGGARPVIESVSYNNIVFKTTIEKLKGNNIPVGKGLHNEKEIVFRARKGNTCYKLELQPVDDRPQDPAACKNIILKVKVAGKTCIYRIAVGEYQLSTLPMY